MDLTSEVGDLLEGYLPPAEGEKKEEPIPAEGEGETQPPASEPTAAEGEKGEEGDGKEGEKRPEEKAGEQGEAGDAGKPEEGKVGVEEGQKPAPAAEGQKHADGQGSQPTELELARKELEELRALLSEVAAGHVQPKPKELTPEEKKAEEERQRAEQNRVLPFLKDDATFDEVMKSSTNFNALLTAVVNTAVERTLRIAPQAVTAMIDQRLTLQTAAKEFYEANNDLLPHRRYVGFVTNEVTSAHPDWDLQKVLEETEKEVRVRLKLPRQNGRPASGAQGTGAGAGEPQRRTPGGNPGFVPGGGGGGRRGSVQDKPTGLAGEVLDLIS